MQNYFPTFFKSHSPPIPSQTSTPSPPPPPLHRDPTDIPKFVKKIKEVIKNLEGYTFDERDSSLFSGPLPLTERNVRSHAFPMIMYENVKLSTTAYGLGSGYLISRDVTCKRDSGECDPLVRWDRNWKPAHDKDGNWIRMSKEEDGKYDVVQLSELKAKLEQLSRDVENGDLDMEDFLDELNGVKNWGGTIKRYPKTFLGAVAAAGSLATWKLHKQSRLRYLNADTGKYHRARNRFIPWAPKTTGCGRCLNHGISVYDKPNPEVEDQCQNCYRRPKRTS